MYEGAMESKTRRTVPTIIFSRYMGAVDACCPIIRFTFVIDILYSKHWIILHHCIGLKQNITRMRLLDASVPTAVAVAAGLF
jgi:hypothetical protein